MLLLLPQRSLYLARSDKGSTRTASHRGIRSGRCCSPRKKGDSVSHGVFINYRRDDAGPYARLMKIRLGQRFPETNVFMDLDSIDVGADFAEAIESAVCSCAVLVALIGRRWLTITDDEGRRRLDNPDDYVRFEIQAALERRIRVIPVLVDGAVAPRQQQLPHDLRKVARLNALEMSYSRYEYDEARLLAAIERILTSETAVPTGNPNRGQ
jgi:hypothetical protein